MQADATATGTTVPPQPCGFPGLRCPLCGAEDTVRIRAHDAEIECSDCGEDIDRATIKATILQWRRLIQWLDAIEFVEG